MMRETHTLLFLVFSMLICICITNPMLDYVPCPVNPTCEVNEFGILKPYPPDCSQFIYCDATGNEVISICPSGMHFSPTKAHCMSIATAGCVQCEITTTTTLPPTTTQPACPPMPTCSMSELGIWKPYPPDCKYFIYCDEFGQGRKSICRNGTEFSPSLGYCTAPAEANCPFCVVP